MAEGAEYCERGKATHKADAISGHREGPQLTVEADEQTNVLETYGRYYADSI